MQKIQSRKLYSYILEYPTGGVFDLFLLLGDRDLDLDLLFRLGDRDLERLDNMEWPALGGERGLTVLESNPGLTVLESNPINLTQYNF